MMKPDTVDELTDKRESDILTITKYVVKKSETNLNLYDFVSSQKQHCCWVSRFYSCFDSPDGVGGSLIDF